MGEESDLEGAEALKEMDLEEAQRQGGDARHLTAGDLMDTHALLERSHFRKGGNSKHFNASSLGYCLRRQILARGGVPSTEDRLEAKTLRAFDWGDQMHTFVRNRVKRFGLMVAEEVYLKDAEWGLSGYIDMIWGGMPEALPQELRDKYKPEFVAFLDSLRAYVGESYELPLPVEGVEIKSAKSYAMERAYKEGPQLQHMFQLGAYKLMSDRNPEQMPVIPEAWKVLMVGKDSVGTLEFGLTLGWVKRVEDKIEQLVHLWEHPDEVPPCTCGLSPGMGWEAKYCKYIHPDDIPLRTSRKKDLVIRCCGDELLGEVERT